MRAKVALFGAIPSLVVLAEGGPPPIRRRLRFESPGLRPLKIMAEREGFEPSVRFYPYNRLAGGCLQPTRPPLRSCLIVAAGEGFEPTEARASAVFKTAALSHSALPP